MSDNRRRPLMIGTEEEYKECEASYNAYMKELDSYKQDPVSWKQIMVNELEKNPNRIDLITRLQSIQEGKYAKGLLNNALLHFLAMQDYRAKESFREDIKNLFSKDSETKQKAKTSIKSRFVKSLVDDTGIIVPVNFNLQPLEDIVEEVSKQCVNIVPQENALVPVESSVNTSFFKAREVFEEFLKEKGIDIDALQEMTESPATTNHKGVRKVLQTSKVFHEVQTPKNDPNKETSFEIGE